jgi:catechol 2,3-dioxygenase-like lactoylglutathione lyase family enzyme
MIDHFTVTVSDADRSRAFYDKVLEPLGYALKMSFEGFHGYGDEKPCLWIKQGPVATQPMHIAFLAPSRAAVDSFHRVALAMGAEDNGAPGVREHYHEHYYAAFVVDPDGHPIEAVCHADPHVAPAAPSVAAKAVKSKAVKSKAVKSKVVKSKVVKSKAAKAKKPSKPAAKGKKKPSRGK